MVFPSDTCRLFYYDNGVKWFFQVFLGSAVVFSAGGGGAKDKMVKNVNIEEVLARFKQALGLRFDKEVAELLGISSKDFGNRKLRGTILAPLLELADERGVDRERLLSGVEPEGRYHSDRKLDKVLAQIVNLEGIDQPMTLSKQEAMLIVMLRGLSEERRKQYQDAIGESFLVAKRREN